MSYNEFSYPVDSKITENKDNKAIIEISPCYPGYGLTLGNSLRRVLLSSIPGGAVTSLKIDGVKHEFSAIDGVYENVIDIILNIKKLRFQVHTDKPVSLTLKANGKKKVTGKDIEKNADAEVINKDQFVCELTDSKSITEMTLVVEKGIGYSSIERREFAKKEIGVIEIDTLFSPITKVSFDVTGTRLGKRTDYEKLTMEIESDGSIDPFEAFKRASKELSKSYAVLADAKVAEIEKEVKDIKKKKAEDDKVKAELEAEEAKSIEETKEPAAKEEEDFNSYTLEKIGLTPKLIKVLNKADINTVEDILAFKKDDLLNLSGIGESSIKEIKKGLGKYGIILSK